uniref:Tetraspanin n=1 Tax=Plectus sambesii TaxID=2011161 RepID=A0A914WQJ1_9BILA
MTKARCSTCLSVTLFCLNLFFCLCGLALIAVSLWGYYDNNFERELKAELNKDNFQYAKEGFIGVVWFLFSVGVFAFAIGVLGCIRALTTNRCIIGFYIVSIFVLFLIGLGVGIFVLACRARIRNEFKVVVEKAYNADRGGMAAVEKRFCCGYGNRNGTAVREPPPESCNGKSVMTPCADALWDQLDRLLMISGIVLIVALVLMAIAILLSCALCRTVKRGRILCDIKPKLRSVNPSLHINSF